MQPHTLWVKRDATEATVAKYLKYVRASRNRSPFLLRKGSIMSDLNASMWEELHKEIRHQPKYPVEDVVRFVKVNFKNGGKILDDGCGAGRHVKFLADEGYTPFGIDISEHGVECTKLRLKDAGYDFDENILQASCDELPFEDGIFDAVISYGVFYYLHDKEIRKSIDEMYRVLKNGGRALVNVRSMEDYRFNPATISESDPHECVIDEGHEDRSAFKENGMHMHFFDRGELKVLFQEFSEVKINSIKIYHGEDTYADVDYLIECVK